MTTFSMFDWPYAVKRVVVTDGSSNQTTGDWVPETTTETAITAHVSEVSQKKLQYVDPGLIALGVRELRCASSVGLVVGDRVKITEVDASETLWVVNAKHATTVLIKEQREYFLLTRKD